MIFFQQHLGFNIHDEIKPLDWLFFPQQRLATIYKGQVFHDDLNLIAIKKKLEYYPIDIWYYLMACEWEKIATEEAFVGRCGDVDDDLGSSLIASRIIQSLVNLCFLQEKKYIPYSKWYGTAFKDLEAARTLYPICISILHSSNWKERESYLSIAYSFMANKHNELQITEPLNAVVKPYY